jgi:hypothetical protein
MLAIVESRQSTDTLPYFVQVLVSKYKPVLEPRIMGEVKQIINK